MNAFGSSPSPFGRSLFGGANGQQQFQQPQQQMQNPFMQSSGGGFGGGFGSNQGFGGQGGYGGFGGGFGQQQGGFGNNQGFGGQGGYGGFGGNQGFSGFQQGGYGGFGGGFNPMQGGYGGGQMQNPFMSGMGFGGGYDGGMGFGGQPQRQMVSDMGNNTRGGFGDPVPDVYRPKNFGGGDNMATPFVTTPDQHLAQNQEFLGYQKQNEDLTRQMNEYMQKAPMYQQLQDLQGKMQGVQRRYAPQAPMYQQQPQQRGQYQNFNSMQQPQQQFGGLAALFGGLGGMGRMGRMGRMPQQGAYEQYVDRNNAALASPTQAVTQPTMSRADFDAREQQLKSRGVQTHQFS